MRRGWSLQVCRALLLLVLPILLVPAVPWNGAAPVKG